MSDTQPSHSDKILDVLLGSVGPTYRLGDVEVRIIEEKTPCGGSFAWSRKVADGEWRTEGCICHNPALGV